MIFLVTPLCLRRSLKSLGFASFLSCAIFVAFIGILVGKLASDVVEGKPLPPLRLLPDTERVQIREMVSVIAVMTTAYVCHFCVHPLAWPPCNSHH